MSRTLKDTKAVKQIQWMRVPSWYRQMRRRKERARADALRNAKESQHRYPKTDKWEYF